jgi:hypothetical protein
MPPSTRSPGIDEPAYDGTGATANIRRLAASPQRLQVKVEARR